MIFQSVCNVTARLGPKIKSLDFPLSHFLALVLPIERKYSKGLRDHDFLVTTEDAGKPAARRSAEVCVCRVCACLFTMDVCVCVCVRVCACVIAPHRSAEVSVMCVCACAR